ncbi:hypothetical protein [Paenibacillus urinalis]|uniref:hypothetical protein n=1 Tax=Paenibacillus urinalis TaxID=521520 RepID=UPI00195F3C40
MFKIYYRIVDDMDELKKVSRKEFDDEYADIFGFFSIRIGNEIEGFYHDRELRDGETGHEMLTAWFELYLTALEGLYEFGYAAFREAGTLDSWLEFRMKDNQVQISAAKDTLHNSEYILFIDEKRFEYPRWRDIGIPFADFRDEIINQTKSFVDEVKSLNSELGESQLIQSLLSKINSRNDPTGPFPTCLRDH